MSVREVYSKLCFEYSAVYRFNFGTFVCSVLLYALLSILTCLSCETYLHLFLMTCNLRFLFP